MLRVLGIAPFEKLGDCERQRLVEHRIDHFEKRDFEDRDLGQVGPQREDAAYEQAAGAAALDGELLRVRVLLCDQMLGTSDEIREAVALGEHLAAVMPGLAHFAAATYV